MTISDEIRSLARDGICVADIARRLGIRYQHAYNVLKASNMLPAARSSSKSTESGSFSRSSSRQKPQLSAEELIIGGFEFSGQWILSDTDVLTPDKPLPAAAGVYAFAKDGIVHYVGVATIGLAKRIYFYGKPGSKQITNQRINSIIRRDLIAGSLIEIYTAIPPDFEWKGLPIHGSAGLELGLIKKYSLPWNLRSAT